MLRVDLAAAGIPYRDAAGLVFDFHSLRCETATLADAAGVSPRVVQKMMRHSTLELTGKYTRPRAVDIEAAASMLPSLKPAGDRPENLAMTGTDGPAGHRQLSDPTGSDPGGSGAEASHISELFAHHLPTGGDVSGRDVSFPDVINLSDALGSMKAETPEKKPSDAVCRVTTASDPSVPKVGLEPTRVLPHRILSPARLPFRHFGRMLRRRRIRATPRTSRPPAGYHRRRARVYSRVARRIAERTRPKIPPGSGHDSDPERRSGIRPSAMSAGLGQASRSEPTFSARLGWTSQAVDLPPP